MFRFARVDRSLGLVLAAIVGLGSSVGQAWTAIGIAAFVYFLASIDAKPAWKFQFDPPGDQDSGRAGARFSTWRRVGPASPRDRFGRASF